MIYENPIVAAGRIEQRAKAQAFANYAIALGLAKGSLPLATQLFEKRWPRSIHLDAIKLHQKAAVAPMNTIDSSSAAPLAPLAALASAFVDYLRPRTIIGRMEGFRSLPLNVRVGRATAGSSVRWTGQGVSAILGTLNFDSIIFKIGKVTGIVVFTKELAQLASPDAEQLIRQDLAAATAQFSDQRFWTRPLLRLQI